MTTLITAKLKKTDDQTNIDKYRVAANIREQVSYYIKINFPQNHHSKVHADKAIIYVKIIFENIKNQNVQIDVRTFQSQ